MCDFWPFWAALGGFGRIYIIFSGFWHLVTCGQILTQLKHSLGSFRLVWAVLGSGRRVDKFQFQPQFKHSLGGFGLFLAILGDFGRFCAFGDLWAYLNPMSDTPWAILGDFRWFWELWAVLGIGRLWEKRDSHQNSTIYSI